MIIKCYTDEEYPEGTGGTVIVSNKTLKKQSREFKGIDVITKVFVLMICCLFPLFVHDKYFDILKTKYYFYSACVISMILVFIAYILIIRKEERKGLFLTMKSKIKSRKSVDLAVVAFWVIAAVSMFSSEYFYESFWGNEGRYSGFFLITLYVCAYFIISLCWKFKTWYLDAFLTASLLVCLFGITDYFQLDILGFKINMLPEEVPIFTSTIGNINTYTAYVSLAVASSAVLFTTSGERMHRLFYYVCMCISFFAIIMGVSDNAYISLAALFGLLPLYLFSKKDGVKKYLIVIATFFSVIQCIDWINTAMGDKVLGIESAFDLIISYKGLLQIVLVLWLIVGIWYAVDYYTKNQWEIRGNWLRVSWLALLIAVIGAVGFVLYDCNVLGNTEKYAVLSNYLIFNDDWGTNRGYIWRNALESYSQFSPWKKLVGYGPDTFGILLKEKTKDNIYRQIFDSAHNEYIHYLLTVGIAGLTAYLVFLGSFIKNCIKKASDKPYVMALVFAVVCYAAQGFVNINLPITTPIQWLMISMGIAACREEL